MWVQSLGQEDPLEKGMANSLQYSCPENPMDRGAWKATVHSVAKSQTQPKWQHSTGKEGGRWEEAKVYKEEFELLSFLSSWEQSWSMPSSAFLGPLYLGNSLSPVTATILFPDSLQKCMVRISKSLRLGQPIGIYCCVGQSYSEGSLMAALGYAPEAPISG